MQSSHTLSGTFCPDASSTLMTRAHGGSPLEHCKSVHKGRNCQKCRMCLAGGDVLGKAARELNKEESYRAECRVRASPGDLPLGVLSLFLSGALRDCHKVNMLVTLRQGFCYSSISAWAPSCSIGTCLLLSAGQNSIRDGESAGRRRWSVHQGPCKKLASTSTPTAKLKYSKETA